MDLFDLALIFFFIVLPLIEGLARRKKPPPTGGPGQSRPPQGRPGQTHRRPAEVESPRGVEAGAGGESGASAADMVPEDLWAVLTGERPSAGTTTAEQEPAGEEEEWWVSEPSPEWDEVGTDEIGGQWEEAEIGAEEEDVVLTGYRPEPLSQEYYGPEAYSLEGPPPLPEKRHTRFHDRIDALKAADRQRALPVERTALGRALRSPSGLRQAVLMKEILGAPKGLE